MAAKAVAASLRLVSPGAIGQHSGWHGLLSAWGMG
jgi:hypothetical protein